MNDDLFCLIYKDVMFSVCQTLGEVELSKFNFVEGQNLNEDDVKIMKISNVKELLEEVEE